MYSNVDCYELKLACYKYKLFPENLKVMTKQRTRIYTQSKNTTTKNHQTRKESSKRRNRGTTNEPENNKMAITMYLLVIILNTN